MDKKVGMKGRGGGKFPLMLRGLAFLLSLFFLLLTPFSAFGYGEVTSTYDRLDARIFTDQTTPFYQVTDVYGKDVVLRRQFNDVEQSELDFIQIFVDFTETVNKGDILQFDFSMPLSRYKGFDFNITATTYTVNGAASKNFFDVDGTVNGDTEYSNGDILYSYSYGGTVASAEAFHFENSANFTYTGKIRYSIIIKNFKYSTTGAASLPLYVALENFVVSIESPESGNSKKLLSNITNILTAIMSIPSKISEGFSELFGEDGSIGKFFSGLIDGVKSTIDIVTSSISSGFSGLLTDLTEWFSDIGSWFTNLGNNIKQWFIDITNSIKGFFNSLGDRISGFFETIWNNTVEFFTSLFKPSDDYFDNLRADLDSYMSQHLGAVYNVPKELITQLTTIVNGLKGSNANHLYIAIPEFSFRLKGEKHTLLESQQFDLLSAVNAIDEGGFKSAYNVVLVIMHGMIDLALAIGCFRMIYKKIINKVGIEGGDEL